MYYCTFSSENWFFFLINGDILLSTCPSGSRRIATTSFQIYCLRLSAAGLALGKGRQRIIFVFLVHRELVKRWAFNHTGRGSNPRSPIGKASLCQFHLSPQGRGQRIISVACLPFSQLGLGMFGVSHWNSCVGLSRNSASALCHPTIPLSGVSKHLAKRDGNLRLIFYKWCMIYISELVLVCARDAYCLQTVWYYSPKRDNLFLLFHSHL